MYWNAKLTATAIPAYSPSVLRWIRTCDFPLGLVGQARDLVAPGRVGVEARSQVRQVLPVGVVDVAQRAAGRAHPQRHPRQRVKADRLQHRLLHSPRGAGDSVPA